MNLIPLDEVISEALGVGKASKKVMNAYNRAISKLGTEFGILMHKSEDSLYANLPAKIAQGIMLVRENEVSINPGYDGEYGIIKIFGVNKKQEGPSVEKQLTFNRRG